MREKVNTTIREMTEADIPTVLEIDRLSFPIPWSERTYRFEISNNRASTMRVAVVLENGAERIIGYIGYWFIIDEAHVSTIAVHPDFRRMGVGDQLFRSALHSAVEDGAEIITLEVRVSNDGAVNLYRKYGFEIVGDRPKYYRDNNEDAWIMALKDISSVVDDGGEW
jgi:ribosomal-protein-alanine N-acetyltransferase